MKADSYEGTEVVPMTWSLIECAVGIISCCLPTLRLLPVLVFGTTFSSAMLAVGSSGSKRFRHIVSGNSHKSLKDGVFPSEGTAMNYT